MGLILITHDLGVVADVADKIAVMYAGRIVEQARVDEIYQHPPIRTPRACSSRSRGSTEGPAADRDQGSAADLVDASPRAARSTRGARTRGTGARPTMPPLYAVAGRRASACHYWEEVIAK